MVENVNRKLILIFIVLGLAALFLALPKFRFRLGLDLQGGTRLVYRFDFEEEKARGALEQDADPQEILRDTIAIIRERIDPEGVREPRLVQEGSNRLVIELPGLDDVVATAASGVLATDLPAGATELRLDEAHDFAAFPAMGGVIRIGEERLRYGARRGTVLDGLQRGAQSTARADHPVGAQVELISDDVIRARIENLGELSFEIVAEASDLAGTGTDLVEQRTRLEAWVAANPGRSLADYNRLSFEEGGPHPYIRWVPAKRATAEDLRDELERATPLLRFANMPQYRDRSWTFTGAELAHARPSVNDYGQPVVAFEFEDAYRVAFRRFTREFTGRHMAIVLNQAIETAPVIRVELPGGGIIEGQYTVDEVRELVSVLRSGSLRLRPILEAEERVGPTLGADYVRRGALSGVVGIVLVLAFMIAYYRRLGVIAAVSLFANMLFLLGGMAFMQATLTLPGLAGIVLTIGMAVDANILIFDRIREERDNGRNIKQAAKSGFEKAFVTIMDANLTTLITALILYWQGTGPVKGFAVTLTIGILGSLFASLVLTRVLVHFALERGVKEFKMGTWLVTANYDWMRMVRVALPASIALTVLGLGVFAMAPRNAKFGIDFLGGATVQVRTEEPQPTAAIRQRVAGLAGSIGQATVTPLLASAVGDGYTLFRIEFKLDEIDPRAADSGDLEREFQSEIRRGLADVVQRGPVEVTVDAVQAGAPATVELYLTEPHPIEDVATAMTAAGLGDPAVQAAGARPGVYRIQGNLASAVTAPTLATQVQEALRGRSDSRGVPFALSLPIPESTLISNQVVGEIRDRAIIAVFLSLFAIVMYIRLRFAEYSYGIAAVLSLAHDVIMAMGAMAFMAWTGLLRTEITLTAVAAFLTIIGYSLNDTIIVFDRIRENLPRVEKPLRDVVNLSINQTLSRTIMTSGTTLMAVAALFFFNVGTGNALETFSFAMMIGILVGTYSSVFIASPALIWLETRRVAREETRRVEAERRPQTA